MNIHETYIKRCLQIGKLGLGLTRPNPMVGSVIVHENKIIGEGYTSAYGGHHAEVNAINAVENKSLLKESTLYVSLEPCAHFGKTPPCSDLIIKQGISHVVIGCIDDNPEVSGNGIKRLKESGCQVTVGILENECKKHHKRFFTFHNKRRPYIILKWAESSDGFIAPKHKNETKPVWITNLVSRQLVHKWRAEEQAILVGTNTVIQDNPSLTVRAWTGNNPIRVVLDKDNRLSKDYNVFNKDADTLVLKENTAQAICNALYKQNINSVIIEGGAQTLKLFINEGLWDEARVFNGMAEYKDGIKAPNLTRKRYTEKHFENDILRIYQND